MAEIDANTINQIIKEYLMSSELYKKIININTLCDKTDISTNNQNPLYISKILYESESTDPLIYETMKLILENGYKLQGQHNPYYYIFNNKNCHDIYRKIQILSLHCPLIDTNSYRHEIWNNKRESNYEIINLLINQDKSEGFYNLHQIMVIGLNGKERDCIDPNMWDRISFDIITFHKLFHNNEKFRSTIYVDSFVTALFLAINIFELIAEIYCDNKSASIIQLIDVIINKYYKEHNLVEKIGDHCYKVLYNESRMWYAVEHNNVFEIINHLEKTYGIRYRGERVNGTALMETNYCHSKMIFVENLVQVGECPFDVQIPIFKLLENPNYDKDNMIALYLIKTCEITELNFKWLTHCLMFPDKCLYNENTVINEIVLNGLKKYSDRIIKYITNEIVDINTNTNNNIKNNHILALEKIMLLFKDHDFIDMMTKYILNSNENNMSFLIGYIMVKNNIRFGKYCFTSRSMYESDNDFTDGFKLQVIKCTTYHKGIKKLCGKPVFVPKNIYNKQLIVFIWILNNNLIPSYLKQVFKSILIPYVFLNYND